MNIYYFKQISNLISLSILLKFIAQQYYGNSFTSAMNKRKETILFLVNLNPISLSFLLKLTAYWNYVKN